MDTAVVFFEKYSGAANDFILVSSEYQTGLDAALVRRLCDRRNGIGADGLMVISAPPAAAAVAPATTEPTTAEPSAAVPSTTDLDFTVTFYNADGHGGMLCGNGARCALAWAERQCLPTQAGWLRFAFAGLVYRGRILGDSQYELEIGTKPLFREETALPLADGSLVAAWYVDVGSRHLVVDLADLPAYPDLDALPFDQLGSQLRHHSRFAPEGVNVNICQYEAGLLKIRTWERGVEAETLACGTGSVSAALVSARRYGLAAPIELLTRGGAKLTVSFDKSDAPGTLSLRGPACFVFCGEFPL